MKETNEDINITFEKTICSMLDIIMRKLLKCFSPLSLKKI